MSYALGYALVLRQLSNLFGLTRSERRLARAAHLLAREQTAASIHATSGKYESKFEHLNSNHALIYIYWLSHASHRLSDGLNSLPTKIFLLNKALHSVDIYYEVELPALFFCEHPVGTVLGRATYGDNFFFYQNCTVGGSIRNGQVAYPKLGKNVRMYSGASILGDARVGDNVTLGAGATVKNESVGPNVVVFGQSPNLVIKPLAN